MYTMHQLREITDAVPLYALRTRRLPSGSAAAVIITLSALLWDGLFTLARLLATCG